MPKTNSVNLMASTIDLSRLKAVPLFLKSQKYAYKKDSSPGTLDLGLSQLLNVLEHGVGSLDQRGWSLPRQNVPEHAKLFSKTC